MHVPVQVEPVKVKKQGTVCLCVLHQAFINTLQAAGYTEGEGLGGHDERRFCGMQASAAAVEFTRCGNLTMKTELRDRGSRTSRYCHTKY